MLWDLEYVCSGFNPWDSPVSKLTPLVHEDHIISLAVLLDQVGLQDVSVQVILHTSPDGF